MSAKRSVPHSRPDKDTPRNQPHPTRGTRLHQWLRRLKIQTRLIVAFLLLSMAPLVATGLLAYRTSSHAMETRISGYSSALVGQVARNIRTETMRAESVALDLSVSDEIQKALEYWTKLDASARLEATKKINLSVGAKTLGNKALRNTVLFVDAETTFGGANTLFDKDAYARRMEASKGKTGASFWQIEAAKDGTPSLVLNRVITSSISMRPLGLISITVDGGVFGEILSAVDLDAGTELFLLDDAGLLLAQRDRAAAAPTGTPSPSAPDGTADGTAAARSFGTPFPDPALVPAVLEAIQAEKTTRSYQLGDTNSLLAFSPVPGTTWLLCAAIPFATLDEASNTLRDLILVIALVCLAAAVVLSFLITGSISSPLRRLMTAMESAKSGHLAQTFTDQGRDEIAQVTESFHAMLAQLRALIDQVSDASTAVLDDSGRIAGSSGRSRETSEQVATTIEEIAKGATQQARDITDGVSRLQQLAHHIRNAESGIQSMSGEVRDSHHLSLEALASVQVLTDRARETRTASDRIQTDIRSLSQDMREIESITKLISGISDQTNLLALNAAIEAARAGEAGRGFAVVSDEVRLLAEQSKKATAHIGQIVSAIRGKTEATVQEAVRTGDIVQKQMEAVQRTDGSFQTIQAAMERITRHIAVVDEAIVAVNNAKEKALDTFGDVSAVSEETAATTQEVAASTQEQMAEAEALASTSVHLQEMAQGLRQALSRFDA